MTFFISDSQRIHCISDSHGQTKEGKEYKKVLCLGQSYRCHSQLFQVPLDAIEMKNANFSDWKKLASHGNVGCACT